MNTGNVSMQRKKAFYFSHDSNARNDEKIINLRMVHGAEGYGIYFMLIEMLMESSDYKLNANLPALAFHLHADVDVLRAVVEDYDLFEFAEGREYFYSTSLILRVKPLEQLREKCRKAGVKSGEVRRVRAANKSSLEEKNVTASESNVAVDADSLIRLEQVGKSKPANFVPPTDEELRLYCQDAKIAININSFLDYYQSTGWLVGRNKMRDWKAAVRNWHRRDMDQVPINKVNISRVGLPNFRNNRVYERF